MFSTFTGNSRRPRTVNLSGQAGNPFNNTSWTPSTASSATKTVSNAQADREKRQAERNRLRAANQIQRTWRGHQARQQIYEIQRDSFDGLYNVGSNEAVSERLAISFTLLLSFFTARRPEDRRRLSQFVNDCSVVGFADIPPLHASTKRTTRFFQILLEAVNTALAEKYVLISEQPPMHYFHEL